MTSAALDTPPGRQTLGPAAAVRAVSADGWRLWLAPGADAAQVAPAIAALPEGPGRRHLVRDLAGVRAMVKVYNRRAKHGLLRRLRPGRSVSEAAGYMAFARAGIATPRLLLWGEHRRLGLLERGLIATEMIDAPTIADAGGAPELLRATSAALAHIHQAGLAHGDPRTRNFLATAPTPTPFDLCSWSTLTPRAHEWDLVQFLGSALALTGDDSSPAALLDAYTAAGGPAPKCPSDIITRADAYARREGAP